MMEKPIALILSVFLTLSVGKAVAAPVVPGFSVQPYANIGNPAAFSFDPSGVLYVGNQNFPTPGADVRIRRVGIGGSPIEFYGDGTPDPDPVVFDVDGAISGTPGSVLTGGVTLADNRQGYIVAILPDETTIPLFGSPTPLFVNPTSMEFDASGRLVFLDVGDNVRDTGGAVFTSTGGTPTKLFDIERRAAPLDPFGGMAIDETNQVYTASLGTRIQIHDASGALVDEEFATFGSSMIELAFGPSGSPWGGDLYAVTINGKLLRINSEGVVMVVGDGFNQPQDLQFGPDGALYVSDFGSDTIYRIVPIINDLVSFEPQPPFTTTSNTNGCGASFVGKFSFDATLSNVSVQTLTGVEIQVDTLSGGNLLLTDEGLKGVGQSFAVSQTGDYLGGILSPGEVVNVPFTVCLKSFNRFQFFVDVLGETVNDQ